MAESTEQYSVFRIDPVRAAPMGRGVEQVRALIENQLINGCRRQPRSDRKPRALVAYQDAKVRGNVDAVLFAVIGNAGDGLIAESGAQVPPLCSAGMLGARVGLDRL